MARRRVKYDTEAECFVAYSDSGWTEVQAPAEGQYQAPDLSACWPVGSVFLSVVATDPALLLGFGEWLAIGAGRVLVGFNGADSDFDAAEKTGGAKTHTLTSAEMPSHTHVQDAHTHTQNAHNHTQDPHTHTQDAHNHTQNSHTHGMLSLTNASGSVASYEHGTVDASSTASAESSAATGAATATNQAATAVNQNATAANQATTAVNQNATAVNQSAGGGGAHNNLQPFFVVHMWKRTA